MIWFQHDVTAHQDIKLKRLHKKFGMAGIGVWWTILEIVGKEGAGGYIEFKKYPKGDMAEEMNVPSELLDGMITYMGEVELIDRECLPNAILIRKLPERADDYAKRVEREEAAKKRKFREKKNAMTPGRAVLVYFMDRYKEGIGVEYPVNYGRDGRIMADVAEKYGEDGGKQLVDEFLDSDGWHSDKVSIPVFKGTLPELISKLRKKKK